jgi:hypothetical protein
MATFQYNALTSAGRWIIDVCVCFIVLFLTSIPADARRSVQEPVKLTIYPSQVGELEEKYQLIVSPEDQIDADAVPLYEKAIKSIPKNFNQDQIVEWLKLPVEQLPQQQAEETLQKYLEPLKLAVQATRCKECNWPEWKPGGQIENLTEYRKLAYIIELWARLEISRGGYEGATIAMRTGFGMARHVGQGPTILQGLVGSAIGGIMCRELEQYVQGKDSPNLYRAMADMSRPLIEMEQAIENEKKVALGSASNELMREQIKKQMASSVDGTRRTSKRLDNNLNGLQCVEAIRHFTATHAGQLPKVLSDIKDVEVPRDIMSDKTFDYRPTAIGATLQSVIPEGGSERDAFHYEIILKKKLDI